MDIHGKKLEASVINERLLLPLFIEYKLGQDTANRAYT